MLNIFVFIFSLVKCLLISESVLTGLFVFLLSNFENSSYILFMKDVSICVCVCVCVHSCALHVSRRLWGPEKGFKSLELELQVVVSCHLGDGNQTQIIYKSSALILGLVGRFECRGGIKTDKKTTILNLMCICIYFRLGLLKGFDLNHCNGLNKNGLIYSNV